MHTLAARFSPTQSIWEQLSRSFLSLFDSTIDATDCVVWAAILLGITCGVLGAFVVLRRQSLLGDAVGHAVLPGVFIAFILTGSKSTPVLLTGALIAGVLATALISLLQRTTRLKTGECMGVVFTGFYGIGILLYKHAQNRGSVAGLDRFLFGQIAGISLADVGYIAAATVFTLALVVALWRHLAAWSFDEGFAHSIGVPTRAVELAFTLLLTLAIVISIQAVGVVLVAALLVIPAATAYLLTDRLSQMVLLSAIFGAGAGVLGVFASLAVSSDMPTGATMVLAAALLFAFAYLFSPRHGLIPRLARLARRRRDTQAENLLKTLYQIMENRGPPGVVDTDRRFGVSDVASARQESLAQVRKLARIARGRDWLTHNPDPLILTDEGLEEARRVVRNHRLWELFLTQEAHLAADHVHADAEYIEHVLPKDVLAKLEQMLQHPSADPHGKQIPAPK